MSEQADAQATLGTLIDERAGRDAIHVAVEPCVAGESLYPGDPIGILDGKAYSGNCKRVGIVDPFLDRDVEPGDRFWMLLYPRTITGLRHVWTHPDFPELDAASPNSHPAAPAPDRAASERWLRDFIAGADCPGYDVVIQAALDGGRIEAEYAQYGGDINEGDEDTLHFEGRDAHGPIPDVFWDHIEVVTGKKPKKRAKYFSCSC